MTAKFTASVDGTKVTLGTAAEDALQIDSVAKTVSALAPYLLLPGGPAFRAYPAGAIGFSGLATWEQKIFTGESFDTNGAYDTGTGRFQPTVPGIYRVTLRMFINATGGGLGACYAAVRKNGTEVIGNSNSSIPTECGVEVNGLVQMNGTTDYLESWAYVESGITVTVAGGTSVCEFSASFVHA